MKLALYGFVLLLLASGTAYAQFEDFGDDDIGNPAAEANQFNPVQPDFANPGQPANEPAEDPGFQAVNTFRVEVFVSPNGQKLVRVPGFLVEGKTLSGVEHGIDQTNQYVVFNGENNLGNPKLGEFIYPVLEGDETTVSEIKSIREFQGLGTLFEPLAFDYKIGEDGRIQRQLVESKFKNEFDASRINDLRLYFEENVPEGVDEDTYDPQGWAEWTYFYQQLTLWENFVSTELIKQDLLTRTSYDPRIIDDELVNLWQSHKDQADGLSQAQAQRVNEVLNSVSKRETARAQFQDWLQARERDIDEFAVNFDSRQKGSLLKIDGQTFIISKEPQSRIPNYSIAIVTDVLTPHDLLDDEGQLRKFELSQDKSRYE